jgi:flagellar protein FlaF
MLDAAKAYGKLANQTSSPRELEADLLLHAASQLQSVHDNWDDKNREPFDKALLFNRKLWTFFFTSVTSADSPLPVEIRQNVANLGLFVMNETIELTGKPQRDKLDTLIDINRQVAAGLLGRPVTADEGKAADALALAAAAEISNP